MVNFTVSLPEELKAEMDKFPDINWSEQIRKNIQSFLLYKRNQFPPLEFELAELFFTYANDLMQPLMVICLKVTKKMLDSQLIIDRMLFTVKFVKEHFIPHGEDYRVVEAREKKALQGIFRENLLQYTYIIKSDSDVKIPLSPPVDLFRRLNVKMQATFWVDISLTAYVQGFEHPAIKNLSIKVPIDEWKSQANSVLSSYDSDWNQGQISQNSVK